MRVPGATAHVISAGMPPTATPSRSVYVRRRLVAGLVAVGVVIGGVVAVQAIGSDDDGSSGATLTSLSVPGSVPVGATTTLGVASGATASTETAAGTDTNEAATVAPSTSILTTSAPQVSVTAPATPADSSSSTSTSASPTTQVGDELRLDPTAPVVDAAAYGVYDHSAGTWLTATNADTQRPVGSIMKLLTAEVVMEAGDPTKVVTVPQLTLDPDESIIGLYAGEQLPRDVLLRALLIVSANDAAQALARDIGGSEDGFVEMMNEAAAELGLDDTVAANPSGLDEGDAGSTVRDVVTLATHLMENDTFRATVAPTVCQSPRPDVPQHQRAPRRLLRCRRGEDRLDHPRRVRAGRIGDTGHEDAGGRRPRSPHRWRPLHAGGCAARLGLRPRDVTIRREPNRVR